jgi:hypothetical protein
VSTSSISTTSLLGVLFVGLKLTGFINWPWVWVLAPFWVPLAILLSILVVCGLILLAAYIIDSVNK